MDYIATTPEVVPASVQNLRRLGKNVSGYSGETIDLAKVLTDCRRAAEQHGWDHEEIVSADGLRLPALHRKPRESGSETLRVYISAGIHGDEPAGPVAVHEMLARDSFSREVELWVCPCLNPTGFVVNRRENAAGTDLNRQYLQPQAQEIIAHIAWLQEKPKFDLCLCLHEDWEAHGFYLYELNPDGRPTLSERILRRVSAVCPIDPSETIEGWSASGGIIRPNRQDLDRVDWPEALFLVMHKTRLSYTFEAPSDFPLRPRVNALIEATSAAVEGLLAANPRASGHLLF